MVEEEVEFTVADGIVQKSCRYIAVQKNVNWLESDLAQILEFAFCVVHCRKGKFFVVDLSNIGND